MTTTASPEPQHVEVQPVGVFILWKDGKKGVIPHRVLRLSCRCAHCVEEMTGRPLLHPKAVPEDVQALDYMEVGRYALQFLFSDAHSTGIYPFTLLRELGEKHPA